MHFEIENANIYIIKIIKNLSKKFKIDIIQFPNKINKYWYALMVAMVSNYNRRL